MFLFLLALFTLVPALELYLIFTIGADIGILNTLAIIIITGVVGAALAKSQGLTVLARIQSELNSGEIPASNIIHGLLVFGGGLLLLTPGFLTDILGFSMVIPGTRHAIVLFLKNKFKTGIQNGNIYFSTFSNMQFYNQSEPFKGTQNAQVFEAEYKKEE